jgi:hypothetical protein
VNPPSDAVDAEMQRQQALLAAVDSGQVRGFAPGRAPRALGVQVSAESGLLAYRRNVQALAERALAAVYPRLQAELGPPDFAAMAWSLWRRHPPRSGDLGDWGQALPAYLACQPGMDLELVDLARLEWACHCAERAPDVSPAPETLAALAAAPERVWCARLAPGMQWLAPDRLVWRQGWRARSMSLAEQPAVLHFLRQLMVNPVLATALEACLSRHPEFDVSAWLQQALSEGWLLGLDEAPCAQEST